MILIKEKVIIRLRSWSKKKKKKNNKIKILTQYSMGCVLLSIYLKLGLDKLWATENKVGRGLKK